MKNICLLGLLFFFAGFVSCQSDKLAFSVQTDEVLFQISDYLVGTHAVYCNDGDSLYNESDFAQLMKKSSVSTMRYPGGSVVKYWDWENPTGVMRGDNYSPDWNIADNASPENWTSLDEYLEMAKVSGITPLLGVNITSGYKCNKVEESVARAARMVQYVKDKGFGGAFWYLGNEGQNGGWESEAHLYVKHAKAMKAVDPDIKCMFNQNHMTKKYLGQYMAIAGNYVDIAETHGKWPYGGNPKGYEPGTFEEWQSERPLRDRKNHNRAWRTEADSLRKWAAELGYNDLKFANNEYGTGKISNVHGLDRYNTGLLIIDMLQEHFIGNWYMACYWYWVSDRSDDKDALIAFNHNMRYNPMKYGFEMLAEAQGGKMLKMDDENHPSVYGFAAEKDNEVLIYLINKSNNNTAISIEVKGSGHNNAFVQALINTEDQFGQVDNTTLKVKRNKLNTSLPAMSYTMFTVK